MKNDNMYIKVFEDKNQAWNRMVLKNKACKLANNFRDCYCVVEHPDGFAVVDINTAIDLGGGYEWSCI